MSNAITIEVTRGETVESSHRVDAVVMDASGALVAAFGDTQRLVFPRSAIKALQALPLLETGAADAYSLDAARLAIACASHDHEKAHLDTVRAWLSDIGCGAEDLGCGLQPPDDEATIAALARSGQRADAVYNNCSGKHAGFLTVARHLGEPTGGYIERDHPVQARIRGVLTEMTGVDTEQAPWARDGCSIPTMALPMDAWARAMAKLAGGGGVGDRRAEAAARLSRAITEHPLMIGGQHSWDSQLVRASIGRLLVKRGAEGVACGWLPGTGLGFCMKTADGSSRAVQVAVGKLARELGWLDTAQMQASESIFSPRLKNWNGFDVGGLRAQA